MGRGPGRGRGKFRGRGRGRGAAPVAAAAAEAELGAQEQASEQDSPLSAPVKTNGPSNLVPVTETETLVFMETTEAVDGTVIEPEPSVEVISERHFVSEERSKEEPRGGEFIGLGDTASNVAGNGTGALMEFSVARLEELEKVPGETGMSASANGDEKMTHDVEIVVETVESEVDVSQEAVVAPSYVDLSTIETSLVTSQEKIPLLLPHETKPLMLPHDIMKDVEPLKQEVKESAALETMNKEQAEVVLNASIGSQLLSATRMETMVENSLKGPAVVEPISSNTFHVKTVVAENRANLEGGAVELDSEAGKRKGKHETGDLAFVKLEVGDEKTNVDLSVDRLDEGNEAPLENAGNARDQAEKAFEWEMDDTLDGIEKKYQEQDEYRDGDFEDSKELSGEGAEYDAEAQQSLPLSERRKHKRLEVYVGGLDKDTAEEELKSLFEKAGEVVQVRLMKNPQTGKNKGYAFIRYASAAMAKRAAEELGIIEIRGRECTAKPSEENDTLHLGNINKSWKKEMVLETLKSFNIENIEELTLMDDAQVEGVNRGFAFIEFGTHKDALEAFRKLQQPDAIFGTDRSAKVRWAQPLYEPDEDTMSQVKSVFVDGMPSTWEEEKIREHFGKFGEIERIVLARNMLSAKRKDFGFVNYVERDAALACIDALNSTEIIDGDVKLKVKVVLAKPQVKSKFGKGIRGGYPLGFRGDHRVGTSPGRAGRGCSSGVGAGFSDGTRCSGSDSPSGGNIGRCENQVKLGTVRELEADKTIVKEKHSHDEMDSNCQLLQSMQDQAAVDSFLLEPEEDKTFTDLEQTDSAPVVTSGAISAETERPSSIVGEIVIKPTLDKFECAMCGFGSDAPDDYEAHKKTKVHRVIEELRKDQKLHNKTPLSLLHEYASRNHCEVNYETKAETNGPFEVIAIIGGAAGGTTGPPTKGFGAGRNKARAKQMAAADALEKIMEKVPEFEFTKPGQSRQRFGDRDRPGRKGKGGGGGNPGGSGGSGRGVGVGVGVGGGGSSGYRNPRERPNNDWRPALTSISVPGATRLGGVVGGRSRRPDGNNLYLGGGGGGGGGGGSSYPSNPNAIPITGYSNDFPRVGSRSSYVDRYAGRGGTGYNMSLRGGRGGMPSHSETYAERYDRIQGGRGYGGSGYGGREYLGGVGVGVGVGGNSYGVRDVGGIGYGGRELTAALGYGGRELHPVGGYGGPSREYEGAGIKRPYATMDEDARYLDAQRGLPRQRLEAPEPVPIQQSGGVQGYGAQSMYSDAARASIVQQPMYTDASRAPVVRPQEQSQYNAYGQQSQGLPVPHNIGQAPHMPTQHVSVQHVPAQHLPSQLVSAQHISAQHVQTQHAPTQHAQTQHIQTQHVHTQQATMPITMVGGSGQGGTPYSIYDAAPQSTVGVPAGTGQMATHTYSHQYAPATHNYGGYAMNQEYVVNTAVPVQEMTQANSYPAQSAYGAQYGVMQQQQQQQVPQQRVVYPLQGATQHQQTYY